MYFYFMHQKKLALNQPSIIKLIQIYLFLYHKIQRGLLHQDLKMTKLMKF